LYSDFAKLSLDKIVQVNISYFLLTTYHVVFSLSVWYFL